MNYLNFFIAALLTITFSLTTTVSIAADGGPRTVIQAMTDVIVEQPTASHLETTIINSQGATVIEAETETASRVISLEGLESGTYTVETVDDNGDYQVFSITVE